MKKTISCDDKIPAWVAWSNTDLTEGRGSEFPLHVCLTEQTARRVGKKGSVQGCDCDIREDFLFRVGGRWYGPVYVAAATAEDILAAEKAEAEKKKEIAKIKAIEKAKAAGLSPEDIEALR